MGGHPQTVSEDRVTSVSQEDWYYQTGEASVGPLSLTQLKALYAEGKLNEQTLVRNGSDGPWETLASSLDLSSDEVTAADLDRFLAAEAPSDADTALADADDLAGMLASDSEIPIPAQRPSREDSPHRDRRWYCQILGQELGPFEFDDLNEMVLDGELSPTDLVRVGPQGKWEPASTIVGLFEAAPKSTPQPPTQGVSTGLLSPQRGAPQGGASKKTPAPQPAPTTSSAPQEDDDEAIWFYRVLSQELGPVTLGRLMKMAKSGSLSPNDEIRMSGVRQWMPASSMAGLFTEEQLATAKPSAPPQTKPAAASSKTSPTAATKPANAPPSSVPQEAPKEAPKPAPPAAKEKETVAPAPKPSSPPPSTPPRPASMPPSSPAGSTSRPGPASRAFTPPPKKAQKKSSGGGGGWSFSVGDMFSGVQIDPKLVGGLVVGIAVILSIYVLPTVLSAGAGRAAYDETLVVWKQIQAMKQIDAPPNRWSELKTEIEGRHKEFVDELAETASSRQRLLQLMLFCQRDCIMQIISSNGTNEAKYDEMKTYMDEAASIVGN